MQKNGTANPTNWNTLKNNFYAYSAGNSVAELLAERILVAHQGPDFSQLTICLPHLYLANDIKQALLSHSPHRAILGPQFTTLRHWANACSPAETRRLSNPERQLIMVDVLRAHQQLFPKSDLWTLSQQLFQLLDELSQHRVALPDSLDEFTEQLQTFYSAEDSAYLSREAEIVHKLWQAWHSTLNDNAYSDSINDYTQTLATQNCEDAKNWWLAGMDNVLVNEWGWMTRQEGIHILLPDYAYTNAPEQIHSEMIGQSLPEADIIYAAHAESERHIRERAFAFSTLKSELHQRIALLPCDEWEQETTSCIRLLRQWISDDKQRLCVVTENRHFARRLRAKLESANILIQDSAGWVLSTTSAAAAVERWLECIEQDFHYSALLDVLKSPLLHINQENLSELTLTLQRDIIEHENIASNLSRMQEALHYRRQRLAEKGEHYAAELEQLLDSLTSISAPLKNLQQKKSITADEFMQALIESLSALKLTDGLQEDTAGEQLLNHLKLMLESAQQQNVSLTWKDCRSWLGHELESQTFVPQTGIQSIWLTDIKGARGIQFDGLIVASSDDLHLPVARGHSFFFNDSVRKELGLPSQNDHRHLAHQRLNHLVLQSNEVVFSYSKENDQGPQLPAAWIDTLDTFYQLAWQRSFINEEYLSLSKAKDPSLEPKHQPISQPAPTINQFPEQISVSRHQQLIDCPYKFFAHTVLKLRAREDIREALTKQDYGQKAHRCLQAFHVGVPGDYLPGPFTQTITEATQQQAIDLLTAIAEKEFRNDVQDDFQHHHWLNLFLSAIPRYIDWQITQQSNGWFISEMESESSTLINNSKLFGRIDAVEKRDNVFSLIDFKTGYIPKQQDILSGEDVQLSSYALMNDSAQRIQYVPYTEESDKKIVSVEDDELAEVKTQTQHRLNIMIEAIAEGQGLIAQPSEKSCQYCDFSGLCRHHHWEEA